jgi:protein-S-isoprenylcysteine O-methyltransferase Ste14
MVELALILYLAFLAVAFGWRTWIQYRRTGDHGFRGFSGQGPPSERLAGLLFAAALIGLLGAPVATLLGLVRCAELPLPLSALGVALALAGFAVVLVAQLQMGASWRVGVDASERTALVQDGIFAVVRNPIFSGIGVFAVGMLLLVPNILSIAGVILGAIGLQLQVRWVEEPYLLRMHGDAYAEYAQQVGRFVPAVGRLPGQPGG